MAVTKTPRFLFDQWSEGTDPYPGRVGWMDLFKLIEGDPVNGKQGAAIAIPSGPISSRPTGGAFGRLFLATDQGVDPNSGTPTGIVYYHGGTSQGWVELNTNGGGGPGAAVVIEGTATEGKSTRSARADHTHVIRLATKSLHGAMASQDKEFLDNATSSATGGTLVIRGSGGQITAANPTSSAHLTTRFYVDDKIGEFPASAKTPHYGMNPATIVWRFNSGSNNPGSFDAPEPKHDNQVANKFYADQRAGDTYATGGYVVRRWSNGIGGNVKDPDNPETLANKRYVDSRTSRKEWKENDRPLPYALAEIRRLRGRLFDYKSTEEAPLSMRGTKDVLGAYVDEFHEVMPLLTVASEEDGAPERIEDRELIWPVIAAIQELADAQDDLDARLHRVEGYLGL